MLDIASVSKLLTQPQKIVITTHHKPDGDAMGSSLGLFGYLKQLGHDVKVITPTDYPEFLAWLPGNDQVIIFTENREESAALIASASIIFCLDFNALGRINAMGELVGKSAALKIMIDHHLEPEDFDDYRYWDVKACATAQLIYTFIANELKHKELINRDVATCLYTGILTDSKSFSLPNTTPEVYRIAADLMEAGAVNWNIYDQIFNNSTENRLRFLGNCLLSRLEVLYTYNTAIITASKEDLETYEIMTGDTEGIVNYALSISGIRLAAFMVERNDVVKLSLRSTGEFPANEICKKYFNGGGHRNAAGGISYNGLEEVIQQFKLILPEYKNLLIE
jgi:phosphoesterase RecJ-like protein